MTRCPFFACTNSSFLPHRVSENAKLNSMDSKNLAICWWPTLLPIEFTDMLRFESMRPYLEDITQTMIDQYPFLFCGQEAFVMV
jgi:RhoGAP domain